MMTITAPNHIMPSVEPGMEVGEGIGVGVARFARETAGMPVE